MATTTMQQHTVPPTATVAQTTKGASSTNSTTNPQLKRIVYSKYRELLGSYNDKANAIIETLPAYMVREDRGFNCEPNTATTISQNAATITNKTILTLPPTTAKTAKTTAATLLAQSIRQPTTTTVARGKTITTASAADSNGVDTNNTAATLFRQVAAAAAAAAVAQSERMNELYGGSAPQGYEAPACVQNAMGTKDKKPFTYTPGGIDLSQIKSERMAKRIARNAQAEGVPHLQQQQNRPQQPQQPQSPGSGNAASQIGAAGMGMPFQVLPSTPAGKNMNGTSAPPPPPPPPCSISSTLAPPQKTNGLGSAPGSPSAPRKSLTPQRFEPPPLGFRPEIKIPPNPMAALRKVPPPVEKNTFWKDEYVRDRSKSPMVDENGGGVGSASNGCVGGSNGTNGNVIAAGAVTANNGVSVEPTPSPSVSLTNGSSNGENNNNNINNEHVDGFKKPSRFIHHQPEINRSNNLTPPQQTPPSEQQQHQANNKSPPLPASSPPQQQSQQQQQKQSFDSEIRNATPPSQSPVSNVSAPRQNDSPRYENNTPPKRVAESPFRYGGQQQQQQVQQQQRAASVISPLAQPPQAPSPKLDTFSPTALAGTATPTSLNNSPNSQPTAQTVPWRTQRSPAQQTQQQQQPQTTSIYNNVSTLQSTPQQTPAYQGPKPTNVGSLYIAPLAPPTEPQAPSVVRQFQQQQQQSRESPMRQMPTQQQQQQQQPQPLRPNMPWLVGKPKVNDQPEWARPEENGNIVPSSLHRLKSPPPTVMQQSQQPKPTSPYQQQPTPYQTTTPYQQQATPYQQTAPYQQQSTQYQQQPYYKQQPQQQQQQQPQPPQTQFYSFQPEQNNSYGATTTTPANFGCHGVGSTGLRLQINVNSNASGGGITTNQQTGPRERIIPIQLEQTPTTTPSQPNFNVSYGGHVSAPNSYVLRSPNQFVDQGYNNYQTSAGVQQPSGANINAQRVMSPTQNLNAPRIVQQQQQYANNNNNVAAAASAIGGNRSRIIPISMECGSEGTRGPISHSPIVLQNDPRSSPIQSKSFRILQKITDTIDDGNGNESSKVNDSHIDVEPQLQRPQYARQMNAQQARQQPNVVEQMKRMHITSSEAYQQQQQQSQFSQAWNQDMPQSYIHPSEQQVPEPKKYTGSAIPSRSFKILQAMTTPENAAELVASDCVEVNENTLNHNKKVDNKNSKTNMNDNTFDINDTPTTSDQPRNTSSLSSISSLNSDSFTHSIPKHPYPTTCGYPYPYPWYPQPSMPSTNGESIPPPPWPYAYNMPHPAAAAPPLQSFSTSPSSSAATKTTAPTNEHNSNVAYHYYPPHYQFYYPFYPVPPPPPPSPHQHSQSSSSAPYIYPSHELDSQNANAYRTYMPPYPYPYPVPPNYYQSQSTPSSRASSVLPDIIVTPSTDDMPSQVILKHHIKIEKTHSRKRNNAVEIEEVKDNVSNAQQTSDIPREHREGSIIDSLTKRLEDISKVVENNLNLSKEVEKNYAGEHDKEFGQRSPTDNVSPVPVAVPNVTLASETEISTDSESSSDESDDSDKTPKCVATKGLQAIKSVTNIGVFKQRSCQMVEAEYDDDVTTADGESDTSDGEDYDREHEVEELEMDKCSEENDIDDLSVIYEEESEMERSSVKTSTIIHDEYDNTRRSVDTTIEKEDDLNRNTEENDKSANEMEEDLVTARLALKFSINESNVTTVEVGKSQIEEKRHSISSDGGRNSFVLANVKENSDDDENDDDCQVCSNNSSRSSSLEPKLPREYIPTSELRSMGSSNENLPKAFSLNMRNKFLSETIKHDFTNNIAILKAEPAEHRKNNKEDVQKKESNEKVDLVTQVVPSEDLDFFATLRATKLQAQKMMEQSASYWGKSAEKKESRIDKVSEETSVADTIKEKEEEEGTDEESEIDDIWADRNDDYLPKPVPKLKLPAALSNAKADFWSTFEKATKKTVETNKEKEEEKATQEVKIKVENEARSKTEVEAEYEDVEDEVDFWAVIGKSKQTTTDVSEKKKEKAKLASETKNEVSYSPIVKKLQKQDLPTALQAEIHTPPDEADESNESEEEETDDEAETETEEEKQDTEEEEEETGEEEEEEEKCEEDEDDFWASVEKAKTSITSTKSIDRDTNRREEEEKVGDKENFWASAEKIKSTLNAAKPTSLEDLEKLKTVVPVEVENDFWPSPEKQRRIDEDGEEEAKNSYDPTQYPAEPREVDTDEEIDFWAEIKARNRDTDDVDFYKSASFWANRDREILTEKQCANNNSPKTFEPILPDEPTLDVGLWAALEAAKGVEPEYFDATAEGQKMFLEDEGDNKSMSESWDNASLHEPVVANVWEHQKETNDDLSKPFIDLEQWIHNRNDDANINEVIEVSSKNDRKDIMEEANKKRNKFRKAMAFFSTSIDEQKDLTVERRVRESSTSSSSNRNSLIETENLKVNKAEYIESTQDKSYKPKTAADANQTHADGQSTSINFEQKLPQVYVEPTLEGKLLPDGLPDLGLKKEEKKISVRDRISAFESGAMEMPTKQKKKLDIGANQSLSVDSCTQKSTLSRNSSQRSESEMEEDDSGVTDMNKLLSSTDTESESFPELRKMSSYQRASTHSRLYKLLQDDNDALDDDKSNQTLVNEYDLKPSKRKIVHNVSITRRQNPEALIAAETLLQRRERLSLPLHKNISIDADNPSTPNSPASPIMGQPSNSFGISDKLVNELVESLLLKSDSNHLRKLPMEKLQAAAKRVLEEELDSLDNTSVGTTSATSKQNNDNKINKSYADYYETWSRANGKVVEGMPPKAHRPIQDFPRRSGWSVRCPRVLSSKTINRDLTRVTESPEILPRNSKSPDCYTQARESSVSRWRKV